MKKTLMISALMMVASWLPMTSFADDGDVFVAQTVEGIDMRFRVDSEAEKRCFVATHAFVAADTVQTATYELCPVLTIPSEVNGYRVAGIDSLAFSGAEGCVVCTRDLHLPSTIETIYAMAISPTPYKIYENICKNLYITDLAAYCKIDRKCIIAAVNGYSDKIKVEPLFLEHYLYLNDELLTDLVIPEEVDTIKDFTFSWSLSLKSVTIPEGVTVVGEGAFGECLFVRDVYLPTSLKEVGAAAFCGMDELSVHVKDLSAFWHMKIQHDFTHYGINEIPLHLMLNGEEIVDWELPDDITSITDCIYAGFNIRTLKLPEGLTSIGRLAFYNCKDLKDIWLPKSLSRIGEAAFFSSSANLHVADLASFCRLTAGDLYIQESSLYENDQEIVDLQIPAGVETVNNNLFTNCKNIRTVSFPEQIKNIGYKAFGNCTNLESVELPESLTSISGGAFDGCKGIKSVNAKMKASCPVIPTDGYTGAFDAEVYSNAVLSIPKGLTELYMGQADWCRFKNVFDPGRVSDGIYTYLLNEDKTARLYKADTCQLEANLVVPGTYTLNDVEYKVTSIGADVFKEFKELETVVLPEGLLSIGEAAFRECSNLRQVTFPNTLKEIGANVFMYDKKLETVVLPEGLQTIGEAAFRECSNLRQVTFPNTLKEIGANVFMYDKKLETVVLPEGLQTIGEAAFRECSNLRQVTFPKTLKKIGNWAFKHCSELESVILPEGLEELGEGAFSDCFNMTELVLSHSLKIIPLSAFSYTQNLQTLIVPEGVEAIDTWAFRSSGLKTIYLPKSLKMLGDGVFNENYHLKDVWIDQVEPFEYGGYYSDNVFPYSFDEGLRRKVRLVLHVPQGAERAYRNTSGWRNFYRIVEPYDVEIDGIGYRLKDDGTAEVCDAVDWDAKEFSIQKEVTIGGRICPVTSIYYGAFFDYDYPLGKIYCYSEDPPVVDPADYFKRNDYGEAYSEGVSQFFYVNKYNCVIHVPEGCADAYREAYGWKNFKQIVEFDATAIEGIQTGGADDGSIDRIYDVNGIERQQLGRGINIVRMRNGKVKKVYVN